MNTKAEEPTYGAWEHWKDGQCSLVPLRYRPGSAQALIDGSWVEVDSTEAAMSARLLDKGSYHRIFAPLLRR
jgi:hypothetical protein